MPPQRANDFQETRFYCGALIYGDQSQTSSCWKLVWLRRRCFVQCACAISIIIRIEFGGDCEMLSTPSKCDPLTILSMDLCFGNAPFLCLSVNRSCHRRWSLNHTHLWHFAKLMAVDNSWAKINLFIKSKASPISTRAIIKPCCCSTLASILYLFRVSFRISSTYPHTAQPQSPSSTARTLSLRQMLPDFIYEFCIILFGWPNDGRWPFFFWRVVV